MWKTYLSIFAFLSELIRWDMCIGSTTSRRGPAPPRPTATPPSLPRTPVDQIDSESVHLRSHTPLSLGSIASLHNKVIYYFYYSTLLLMIDYRCNTRNQLAHWIYVHIHPVTLKNSYTFCSYKICVRVHPHAKEIYIFVFLCRSIHLVVVLDTQ